MFHPGEKFGKHLVLEEKLGAGQFGEVWRASGMAGLQVALKIIEVDPKDLQKAVKEIRGFRRVTAVRHGYLTPVHSVTILDKDGDELDDSALKALESKVESHGLRGALAHGDVDIPAKIGFGMELADKSLMVRLKEVSEQRGEFGIGPTELLRYMEQAADAIDYLNEPRHKSLGGSGGVSHDELVAIRHCDIKPDNILLLGNVAKICDFGLARLADSTGAIRKTTTGLAASLPYTSPEILTKKEPSEASDQYSLAISFYELATGHLPFDQETQTSPLKMVDAHREGKLLFDRVNAAEQQVLRKATHPDFTQRYPNCVAMVTALKTAGQEGAPPPPIPAKQEVPAPAMSAPPKDSSYHSSFIFNDKLEVGAKPVPGYELVKFLGQGQFGEVWEAVGPFGTRKALKFLNIGEERGLKELKGIFRVVDVRSAFLMSVTDIWMFDGTGRLLDPSEIEEGGTVSSIGSTPLRDTLDIGAAQPKRMVVAMDLGDQSLLQRLEERTAEGFDGIDKRELLKYLDNAAKGIDYLNRPMHMDIETGEDVKVAIYHCDIKPDNIMLVGGGAKICDFGLARVAEKGDIRATSSGVAGSVAYMPPESVNPGIPGPFSDQYSLAITYYELATGDLPFAGEEKDNAVMILDAHSKGRLDFSGLDEEENKREIEVLRKATSVDPRSRYDTCEEFAADLNDAVFGRSTDPIPLPPPRPWWQKVAAAAVLLLLVAGVAYGAVSIFGNGNTVAKDIDDDINDALSKPLPAALSYFSDAKQKLANLDEEERVAKANYLGEKWHRFVDSKSKDVDDASQRLVAIRHLNSLLTVPEGDASKPYRDAMASAKWDEQAHQLRDGLIVDYVRKIELSLPHQTPFREHQLEELRLGLYGGIGALIISGGTFSGDVEHQAMIDLVAQRIKVREAKTTEEFAEISQSLAAIRPSDLSPMNIALKKALTAIALFRASHQRLDDDLAQLENAIRAAKSAHDEVTNLLKGASTSSKWPPEDERWEYDQFTNLISVESSNDSQLSKIVDASKWRLEGSDALRELVVTTWPQKRDPSQQELRNVLDFARQKALSGDFGKAEELIAANRDAPLLTENEALLGELTKVELAIRILRNADSDRDWLASELGVEKPTENDWIRWHRVSDSLLTDANNKPFDASVVALLQAIEFEAAVHLEMEPLPVLTFADHNTTDSWFADYLDYVTALQLAEQNDAEASNRTLLRLYAPESLPSDTSLVRAPHRVARAGEILLRDFGRRDLLPKDRSLRPIAQLLISQNPRREYLDLARRLAIDTSSWHPIHEGLWIIAHSVAHPGDEVNWRVVGEAAVKLLNDTPVGVNAGDDQSEEVSSGETNLKSIETIRGHLNLIAARAIWHHADAMPVKDDWVRVIEHSSKSLARFVEFAVTESGDDNAMQIWHHIIPFIHEIMYSVDSSFLAEPEAISSLAELYRQQGFLIRRSRQVRQEIRSSSTTIDAMTRTSDPAQAAYAALSRANTLDPALESELEELYAYVDQKGLPQDFLGKFKSRLKQISTRHAHNQSPRLADLRGYAEHQHARTLPTIASGPILENAIEQFSQALKLAQSQNESATTMARILLHRSAARNERAMQLSGDAKTTMLHDSVKDANDCINHSTDESDMAILALGHSLEDLAHYSQFQTCKSFKDAIGQFNNLRERAEFSIDERLRARARVAFGRCLYRMQKSCSDADVQATIRRNSTWQNEMRQSLTRALNTLSSFAEGGNDDAVYRQDRADANYHLGILALQSGDLPTARSRLEAAAAEAEGLAVWPKYQIQVAIFEENRSRPQEAKMKALEIIEYARAQFADSEETVLGDEVADAILMVLRNSSVSEQPEFMEEMDEFLDWYSTTSEDRLRLTQLVRLLAERAYHRSVVADSRWPDQAEACKSDIARATEILAKSNYDHKQHKELAARVELAAALAARKDYRTDSTARTPMRAKQTLRKLVDAAAKYDALLEQKMRDNIDAVVKLSSKWEGEDMPSTSQRRTLIKDLLFQDLDPNESDSLVRAIRDSATARFYCTTEFWSQVKYEEGDQDYLDLINEAIQVSLPLLPETAMRGMPLDTGSTFDKLQSAMIQARNKL